MSGGRIIEELLFSTFNISERSLVSYVQNLFDNSRSRADFTKALRRAELDQSLIATFADRVWNRLGSSAEDSNADNGMSKNGRKRIFGLEDEHLEPTDVEFHKLPPTKRQLKAKEDDIWEPTEEEYIEREKVLQEREAQYLSQQRIRESDDRISQELDEARDIRERDELAEKLRQKDSERTKNVVTDKSSKEAERELLSRQNLLNNPELRKQVMPDIRTGSRYKYLEKREVEKLEETRLEILEEERLMQEMPVTEQERRALERKKLILRAAEDRRNVKEEVDGYVMPENYIDEKGRLNKKKQEDPLYRRDYNQRPREKEVYKSEYQIMEESAIASATARFGQQVKKKPEDEYDFVFDESQHVAFVLDERGKEDFTVDPELEKYRKQLEEIRKKRQTMKEVRESLPIFQHRQPLLEAIEQYKVIIVIGETGSGKTTQLPQYLVESGYCKDGKKIGCTQPRRVAAMSVAARVAEEMNVRLGHEVGYSIRFEDCTSDKTQLKYMTDGMLLREFLTDPDLSSYSVMIIDEAHERTLHTDILFPLVKDLVRERDDFRLIISSATMDAEKFSAYFDNAPTYKVPGRKFPVDVFYTKAPEADYLAAAITTVLQIHITQPLGDILVFLTGQDEIEFAQERLKAAAKSLRGRIGELIVAPIYSSLQSEEQAKIFLPTPEGARKVVLATNIAETSITIDGIVYVIDTGFVKQKSYNPKTGMESLQVVPCSKAAANQRMGRAGRVSPGKCFRLYTAWAYHKELEDNPVPEIQRTNLGNVVLMLKSLGLDNLLQFDFMDPPSPEGLSKALELLYSLGALNSKGQLTKLGRKMAEFPLDPMLSKCILVAEKYKCTDEVVSIISLLTIQNMLFITPAKENAVQAENAHKALYQPSGDHMTLLHIWNQWVEYNFSKQYCIENFLQYKSLQKARLTRDQLVNLMDRVECPLVSTPDPSDSNPILKSLTAGFFPNIARLEKGGDYKTIKNHQSVHIHPSSSLHKGDARVVLYYELVLTSKEFVRVCSEIKAEWLLEVAPHFYKEKDVSDDQGKVAGRKMPKAIK